MRVFTHWLYKLVACLFFLSASGQFTIHDLASTGMVIDEATSVRYTSNGNIWIGTASSGIAHYDGNNWQQFDVGSTSGFPNNYIRTLYSFGNTLFAGTGFGGVGKYSGSWSTQTKASTSNGLIDDEILGMAYDQNTLLWYATYGGLSLDSTTKWKVYTTANSNGMVSNLLTCIAINSQNVKWIGTENAGLMSFNNTEWTSYTTSNSGLPSNAINKIAIASNNTLWVATNNGLAEYNGSTWKVYNTSNTAAFASNIINDVAVDNSGNVYAATNAGLVAMSGNVKYWKRTHSGNSNLPENTLTGLALNAAQTSILIATSASGVAEGSINLVVSIDEIDLQDSKVVLYPNPVLDKFTVSVYLDNHIDFVEVEVTDLSGTVVQQKTLQELSAGAYELEIDLGFASAGLYLARIKTPDGGVVVRKIVKY